MYAFSAFKAGSHVAGATAWAVNSDLPSQAGKSGLQQRWKKCRKMPKKLNSIYINVHKKRVNTQKHMNSV